jgi:hypothetical protein
VLRAHIRIFQVMGPCSTVGQYQHFGGTRCFHLQGQSECGEEVVRLYNQVAWMVVTQTHGRRGGCVQSEPIETVNRNCESIKQNLPGARILSSQDKFPVHCF